MATERNSEQYLQESDVFAQDGHIDGPFARRLGLPENATDTQYKEAVDLFYAGVRDPIGTINGQPISRILGKRLGVPEEATDTERLEAIKASFVLALHRRMNKALGIPEETKEEDAKRVYQSASLEIKIEFWKALGFSEEEARYEAGLA